jgi:uncharacterized protein (TIGR03437 family)
VNKTFPTRRSGIRRSTDAPFLLMAIFILIGSSIAFAHAARTKAAGLAPVVDASATIDIDTTAATPIQPGLSGVNDDLGVPVEYWDYRFNALAKQVGYGWVRFPGGSTGDIYNWKTGQEVEDWFKEFYAFSVGPRVEDIDLVSGRGGAAMINAANRANIFRAPLIVCANAFTDTPESIGEMAAYARANHIKVAVWELANEPYLFAGSFPGAFFASPADYLDKMKCFRDAIKAADPDAVVAIFSGDPGAPNKQTPWDAGIAAYPNPYWDAITFHYYPQFSSGGFPQWMADETGALATESSDFITGHLESITPHGTKFLVTEFDSSLVRDTAGNPSLTDGTLWGGIYDAEYIMRMSTLSSVLYLGPHAINQLSGVQETNENRPTVIAAGAAGTPIDTLTLNFGFYLSAQAHGLAVLNGVINHATAAAKTKVTGGEMVPATNAPGGQIPALYAMSYTNAAGALSVVITNKSKIPHHVTINLNGSPATGPFPVEYVTATDASTANTSATPTAITVQTGISQSDVTVPPYSVFRVDVTTPPVATFANSASFQTGPAAPGETVTLYGPRVPSTDGGLPMPGQFSFDDAIIKIVDSRGDTHIAPLESFQPDQAKFVLPERTAPGSATATVLRHGQTVLTGKLEVDRVAPGIYSANENGAGVALAFEFGRQFFPQPVFSCQPGIALSCLSTPITVANSGGGARLLLLGTGLRGAHDLDAYVAGTQVPVLSFGALNPWTGFDYLIISLPDSLAGTGEASVYVVADGQSSNMTTVHIQ